MMIMSFTDSVLPREDYIWTVALWLATRTYPVLLPKQDVMMPSKIKILYPILFFNPQKDAAVGNFVSLKSMCLSADGSPINIIIIYLFNLLIFDLG